MMLQKCLWYRAKFTLASLIFMLYTVDFVLLQRTSIFLNPSKHHWHVNRPLLGESLRRVKFNFLLWKIFKHLHKSQWYVKFKCMYFGGSIKYRLEISFLHIYYCASAQSISACVRKKYWATLNIQGMIRKWCWNVWRKICNRTLSLSRAKLSFVKHHLMALQICRKAAGKGNFYRKCFVTFSTSYFDREAIAFRFQISLGWYNENEMDFGLCFMLTSIFKFWANFQDSKWPANR